MDIADRIQTLRKMKGLSQEELAEDRCFTPGGIKVGKWAKCAGSG